MNEDLLNPCLHNLKDVLLLNSLQNIIDEPTRQQQTACLVVNPITVGNFAFLFNCTPMGRTSDSMMVPT